MDQSVPDYQTPPSPPAPASQPSIITPTSTSASNRKKIIFGILGILLLTAGTATGVFLIRNQKQITKSKASACNVDWVSVTSCFTVPNGCTVSGFRKHTRSASKGTTDGGCVGTNTFPVPPEFSLGPGTYCPRNMADFCEQCVQIDGPGGGTAQYSGDCVIQPTPTTPPTGSPMATPTAPPSITAQCLNVLAYTTSWKALSPAELSKLNPGDTVYFTVQGSSSDNGITQARFTVNSNQRTPVTSKKPGTDNEFYDTVIIPDFSPGKTSLTITVKGELHHPTFGWF